MIPVLFTSSLTVCYLLSIAFVYRVVRSGKTDLSIFYLIFPIAIPFFGAGLIHMISKPNPGKYRHGQEASGSKVKDLTIDFGNIDNFQLPKKLVEEDIVPLEESLYLNKAKEARQQLMGLANDDPSHFMDLLYLARLNEDSEIVHYATTFISEISSQYDKKLSILEKRFEEGTPDLDLLSEYCDFMEDYLSKGLLSKQMEGLLRKEYEERLLQKLSHGTATKDLIRVIHNELTLGFYDLAQRHLTQLSIKSNADDVYYLYLEYYYQNGQFAEFQNMIREMQGKQVVLSKDKQDLLNFWQGKEVMA